MCQILDKPLGIKAVYKDRIFSVVEETNIKQAIAQIQWKWQLW